MKLLKPLTTVLTVAIILSILISVSVQSKPTDGEHKDSVEEKLEAEEMLPEYGRYLQQIVETLEGDPDFSSKLSNVTAEDIRSGKIAAELDFVHHNVRTRLDELKRQEMERLRKLVRIEADLKEGGSYTQHGRRWWSDTGSDEHVDTHMNKYEHVDHGDAHSFSKEDLRKLIIKASNDLEELEKKRRQEFQVYEMEKEYQYQQGLKNLTEEERKEAVHKHEELQNRHKDHARVHHPGSRQQLEEVWEEQDHMPKEEFNPKTFFSLHDINNDGFLDKDEVEALLTQEIKKLYDPNNPEDDPNEMNEEFHRMREEIYAKADKDRNGMISRKEFLDFTQQAEFERDDGWKSIDEQPVYSQDEFRNYEKHRQELLKHQYGYYAPAYHQQMPPPHHMQPPHVVPMDQHQAALHHQQQMAAAQHHAAAAAAGGYQAYPQQGFAAHPQQHQQVPPPQQQQQQQIAGQQQQQQHPSVAPVYAQPPQQAYAQPQPAGYQQQQPGLYQQVPQQQQQPNVAYQQQPPQYQPHPAQAIPNAPPQQPQMNAQPVVGNPTQLPQQQQRYQQPPVQYQQQQPAAGQQQQQQPPQYQQQPPQYQQLPMQAVPQPSGQQQPVVQPAAGQPNVASTHH